jgi:hypothetical protein
MLMTEEIKTIKKLKQDSQFIIFGMRTAINVNFITKVYIPEEHIQGYSIIINTLNDEPYTTKENIPTIEEAIDILEVTLIKIKLVKKQG